MKIPTWMVEHLQEAADPGIAAFAKWLRGEPLAFEEAHLLVMRGWISIDDVRRNGGVLEAFSVDMGIRASDAGAALRFFGSHKPSGVVTPDGMLEYAAGGVLNPPTYVVGLSGTQCIGWVPPQGGELKFSHAAVAAINKKLAWEKIRRVERTTAGNLNIITDDAEGDAVDSTIVQHHCSSNGDYEHWRPMRPGERCSYCGWDYPLRIEVTTHDNDHHMYLNLQTNEIEKGKSFAQEWIENLERNCRWEVSVDGDHWLRATSVGAGSSNESYEPDIWRVATMPDGTKKAVKFWRERKW